MPGDDKWDDNLASWSSVELPSVRRFLALLRRRGDRKILINSLDFLDTAAGSGQCAGDPPAGCRLPRVGISAKWQELEQPSKGSSGFAEHIAHDRDRPMVPLLFLSLLCAKRHDCAHRGLGIGPFRTLGLQPVPVFLPSLKDLEAEEFLVSLLDILPPSVFLNFTAFSISKAGQSL